MIKKEIIVKFYLRKKAGYFQATKYDAIMKKVDTEGNIIGFSILNVSALKEQKPITVTLKSHGHLR